MFEQGYIVTIRHKHDFRLQETFNITATPFKARNVAHQTLVRLHAHDFDEWYIHDISPNVRITYTSSMKTMPA